MEVSLNQTRGLLALRSSLIAAEYELAAELVWRLERPGHAEPLILESQIAATRVLSHDPERIAASDSAERLLWREAREELADRLTARIATAVQFARASENGGQVNGS